MIGLGTKQVPRDVAVAVFDRDNGRCVRCGRTSGLNRHHRTPRGMGGSRRAHDAANLIMLCGSGNLHGCHGWVESHRLRAIEDGYIVPRGMDPATIPVRYPDGLYLLDNEGNRKWVFE